MVIVRVKICGLTRKEDVDHAVDYGSDALGFVFGYVDSPRNLSFERLKDLVTDVPPYVNTVVVTPSSNPELAKIPLEVNPTFLQVYQDSELPGLGKTFSNVIQVVHANQDSENIVLRKCVALSKVSRGILLDSKNANRLGGTGSVHDWRLSRRIRDALYPFPVILAGGLAPANVGQAIREVKPYAVDVSSGVEIKPGVKDKQKVKEFIENAKGA
jgi:phosphoribosylanthranilate isomerase